MARRRFKGTSTASLQAIHDGLVAYLSGAELAKGIAHFAMKSRGVTKIDPEAAANVLDDVSVELAVRALPDQTEIGLVEFGDPADGPQRPQMFPSW